MRLLFIEDDQKNVEAVSGLLTKDRNIQIIDVAMSARDATRKIGSGSYDMVVLDLRIPSEHGNDDENEKHGLEVLNVLQKSGGSVPVIVFSGFATRKMLSAILDEGKREDIFGPKYAGGYPLVRFKDKDETVELAAALSEYARLIKELDGIEITGIDAVVLGIEKSRILRSYCMRSGGSVLDVRQIGGGLSDASVYFVKLYGDNGRFLSQAIAKIGTFSKIKEEHTRYRQHIAANLPLGCMAHQIDSIWGGAWKHAGLFYQAATAYPWTLFDVLRESPGKAADIVSALKAIQKPWHDGSELSQIPVSEIRKRLMPDDKFEQVKHLINPYALEVEDQHVRIWGGCRHGDFHGGNVLVSEDYRPLIIDYGDAGSNFGSIDPITLELSVIFHPDGRRIAPEMMSPERAAKWHDTCAFSDGTKLASFIASCREWAKDWAVGAGNKCVYATVYSLAVRQLKYDPEVRPFALSLINLCAGGILGYEIVDTEVHHDGSA